MFNLLEQGAATEIKDFLSKMKDVLVVEGWAVNYYGDNVTNNGINGDKLVVSNGINHYYFTAAIKTAGNIFGFTGSTGSNWQGNFEGLSLYYLPEYIDETFGATMYEGSNDITEEVNCCLTNEIIENYWIYKNNDDGYLVVLEYEVGLYTQFYFGGARMFDQSRTIAQVWSASVCRNYGSLPDSRYHRPLFSADNYSGGGFRSHTYYNSSFYTSNISDYSNTVRVNGAMLDTFDGVTSGSSNTAPFPNIMISNSGNKVYKGDGSVMGRTKVKFNDKNFPIATKLWFKIIDYQNEYWFPFFEVDGFYTINFETIQPTEVLTFGLNEFICFPHYQKNNPQNIVDDDLGRGLGIALKVAEA